VPAFSYLTEWCKQNEVAVTSQEEMVRNPKVIAFYQEIIESYNKFFSHVEQVKRFRLLPSDWTIETGEMTPKLSLKRKVITEKYRDLIEGIYSE
jgi:long-chain acyl-CoA synthetase